MREGREGRSAQKGKSEVTKAGGADWLWNQKKQRRERLEGKDQGSVPWMERFRCSEGAFPGSQRRQRRQEGKDGEEGEGDQGGGRASRASLGRISGGPGFLGPKRSR